jgi:plastocyanin
MRVRLVLPLVAIALAACGGDNGTGITPPVDTETITVTNSGFVPETLSVVTNTKVIWSATEGTHVIHFTGTLPQGSSGNSSSFSAGSSVNTTFLTVGSYTYADSLIPGNTGVVIVHN